MTLLQEKKDHLIRRNPNLSNSEKEILIDFFNQYSNYESKIDWNKANLTMQDFEEVMRLAKESKSSKTKEAKKDLTKLFTNKPEDFEVIKETEDFIYIYVKTHAGAVFANSFDCGGEGAKWCIGTKDEPKYWDKYIKEENIFILVMFKKPQHDHSKKVMIQIEPPTFFVNVVVWHQNDSTVDYAEYGLEKDSILEVAGQIPRFNEIQKKHKDQENEVKTKFLNIINRELKNNYVKIYDIEYEEFAKELTMDDLQVSRSSGRFTHSINFARHQKYMLCECPRDVVLQIEAEDLYFKEFSKIDSYKVENWTAYRSTRFSFEKLYGEKIERFEVFPNTTALLINCQVKELKFTQSVTQILEDDSKAVVKLIYNTHIENADIKNAEFQCIIENSKKYPGVIDTINPAIEFYDK